MWIHGHLFALNSLDLFFCVFLEGRWRASNKAHSVPRQPQKMLCCVHPCRLCLSFYIWINLLNCLVTILYCQFVGEPLHTNLWPKWCGWDWARHPQELYNKWPDDEIHPHGHMQIGSGGDEAAPWNLSKMCHQYALLIYHNYTRIILLNVSGTRVRWSLRWTICSVISKPTSAMQRHA